MTKKEILLELISCVLTGEYELCEVRRSNKGDLQEYDFVIKKASSKGDRASKRPMTKEEFDRL
ncbi:hypothetical protein HCZ21_00170 [Limosilactobacillus fermentum]|uniref:hypothetical protein n=1 Tax=Limosilactobacillus fermentum TaxID=1613 RepID=UPI000FECE15A|nr:hypothetical protein [Limosilactobacillus fermentum]QAR23028.1 hypothetical protein EQG56_00185 [Limosilactobacillus fermentum]QAR24759.1 hypothetical protein EQG56_10930 [Limosilactobacillus fermentum]